MPELEPSEGETRSGENEALVPIQSAALRIGSLCTGIGGLDLAVEAHFGAALEWYSEIEEAPCEVLRGVYPGVRNLGDLTAVDWAETPLVDIITAGYPCQPFSNAGKRKGASDARHLWPHVADAVRVLRPRYVVVENVRGHLSLGFDAVLGDLAEAGFDAEWCVLRASDVGAPHQRARIFLAATDPNGGRRDGRWSGEPGSEGRRHEAGIGRSEGAGSPVAHAHGLAAGRYGGPASGPEGENARRGEADFGDGSADGAGVAWGDFTPAIERWGAVLGRPAPRPTDDDGRLDPPFVEWMMGYPPGWVARLTRAQALKALGNAVVPQQALAALAELCPEASAIGAAA